MGIGKSYLMESFNNTLWMLDKGKLEIISDVLIKKLHRESLALSRVESKPKEGSDIQMYSSNIAILNVEGMLLPKCSYLDAASGFQSTFQLQEDYKSLIDNPAIERIVLYVDTPGGASIGIPELANDIYESRKIKETVAYVDIKAASAGYYLASACEKIVCKPSSVIGSIGVYMALIKKTNLDYKVNYIQYGDKKVFGATDTEESHEEVLFFQERIDAMGEEFTSDIAKFRSVTQEVVKQTEAAFYTSKDAPSWMFDEIADSSILFN